MAFYHNLVNLVAAGTIGLLAGSGAYAGFDHPSLQFLLRGWVVPSWPDLLVMAATGLIAAFGSWCLTNAYRVTAANLVAPFEYSAVIWATSWGFLIWGLLHGVALALHKLSVDWRRERARRGVVLQPRLPAWLFWFDTATDNSLWGDTGWRTLHCPKRWGTLAGMVGWLWRNPAAGFSWSVIAHAVDLAETFTVTSSGCGLVLDKGQPGQQGWYLVRSSLGAFQFRWVKELGPLQLSFEAGWLLDVYVKDPQAIHYQPKAIFMFEPTIRGLKHG